MTGVKRFVAAFAVDNLAALVALAGYWYCLPPGVSWWDPGEAQVVPYVAGIFHPTGFPAYAIAGWIFCHVVVIGNVAWRMSLFSAIATAAAVGILAYNARVLGASWRIATISALVFASTPLVWQHATRAGVNAFELLAAATALTFALSGRVVWTTLFVAIALATHPISLWLVPGIILILVATCEAPQRTTRTAALAALAFAAGIALYAYLPIRSAMVNAAHLDPTANLPLAYHPIWDYDHPSTPAGFIRLVSGADFTVTQALVRAVRPSDFIGFLEVFFATILGQLGWVACALAAVGVIALRQRRMVIAGLVLVAFGAFPFTISYTLVSDAGKYYLATVWIVALVVALGAAAMERRLGKTNVRLLYAPAALLLIVVALNVTQAGTIFAQREDRSASTIVASVLRFTPDDAVIAAGWYYATPLFYAAYVDKSLGHRLIVTNVDHRTIAALAASHRLYYFPIPSNDTIIEAARLVLVKGGWPEMFQVVSQRRARR